jgi:integrase/recombinase XerD
MNSQLLNDFSNYLKIKGMSQSTIEAYQHDLNKLLNHLDKDITTASYQDLNDFILRLNSSPRTISRKISSIQSFFKYLEKMKLIKNNISEELEKPKIPKSLPKYLKENEGLDLLSSIYSKRDLAIITLFLNCGMRISELISINRSQIENDTLTIVGKGNKERVVYLNEYCFHVLKEYLQQRKDNNEALFISNYNKRISKSAVQKLVKKYLTKIGRGDLSTHKLRHTAATSLLQNGVDIVEIKEILGHESIATTQIYTHVDSERLREASRKNPFNKSFTKK